MYSKRVTKISLNLLSMSRVMLYLPLTFEVCCGLTLFCFGLGWVWCPPADVERVTPWWEGSTTPGLLPPTLLVTALPELMLLLLLRLAPRLLETEFWRPATKWNQIIKRLLLLLLLSFRFNHRSHYKGDSTVSARHLIIEVIMHVQLIKQLVKQWTIIRLANHKN